MSEKLRWEFVNQRLKLQGVLDHSTVPAVWQQQQQWLSRIKECLYVDLTALSRIDSAGLALLLQIAENAQKGQLACQMIGMTDELLSLVDIYHLQPIIIPYFESDNGLIANHDNG